MKRFQSTLTFTVALVAMAMLCQASFAQLLPNAPWNKAKTYIDSDGCTVDSATGQKLSCPLAQRVAQRLTPAAPEPADYVASSYAVQSAPIVVVRSGGSSGSATSFGSSGSLAVGQRDGDGYVITSIGSTISPSIAVPATQPTAQGIAPLAIGDRIAFRRSLLEAARNARKSGEITSIQFFMLSAASRNPAVLDKMQQAVHEAAIEEGLATTQAIDWDGLISFIEKLIPIIIQLIDLFS